MGVPQDERDLLQGAYTRFAAIFTWTSQDDEVARERFKLWLDFARLEQETEIVAKHTRAYSLIGARTVVIIGLSKTMQGLYRYCSEITFKTGIEANFYHAADITELVDIV